MPRPSKPDRPRDARGWRIPAPGTQARKVYILIDQGKSQAEAAEILGVRPSNIKSIVWHFQNPDRIKSRRIRELAERLKQYPQAITFTQCKAARALLGWSRAKLAEEANVKLDMVSQWENTRRISQRRSVVFRRVLERAGIEFIGDTGVNLRLDEQQAGLQRHPSRLRNPVTGQPSPRPVAG